MNAKKARAMISIGASSADMDGGLRGAKKKLKGFGADAKKIMGKGIGGGGKLLGGAAKMIGGGLGIQAAGGITDMLTDMLGFEKNLTRFQIASGKSTIEMFALRTSILGVSKATGVAQTDVLAGAQTYVDLTGDVKGAEAAMNSFARIAQASGASVSDVATATAALQQSMKLDPRDIEKVFSGLISQGKMGAVSLKDFAGELSALAPKFAKFGGGTGNEAILNLGAAFQVARQGFGSASEAATGLEALMGSLAQNAGKFQKAGVKIYNTGKNGKKEFRSFGSIVDAIGKSKLAKDPTLLSKAFGSKEAVDAYTQLSKNKGMLDSLAEAGRDAGAVQRDLATYQQSSAGKMEVAWNTVKVALAEALNPERVEKFAQAIVALSALLASTIGLVDDLQKSVYDTVDEAMAQRMGVGAKSRTDKVKRAGELSAMTPEQLKKRGGFTTKQRDMAVKQLMEESTMQNTNQQAMVGFDQGVSQQRTNTQIASVNKLAKQITDALAKANVTVKIDSSSANQVLANSPSHRKGKGRH